MQEITRRNLLVASLGGAVSAGLAACVTQPPKPPAPPAASPSGAPSPASPPDWEGLRSNTQREKFRIVADGRWDNERIYAGGTVMMLHYAKTLLEEAHEGVVDNILINPHLGMRLNGNWAFEARLGYLQAMQRDRVTDSGWLTPKGGELWLSLSRWNLTLDNKLYVGENLLPLFAAYGEELYEASTFYGVTGNIYNRTALSYNRNFFNDTLSLEAKFIAHYDGVGVGLQQVLKLGVNFEKLFFGKKK